MRDDRADSLPTDPSLPARDKEAAEGLIRTALQLEQNDAGYASFAWNAATVGLRDFSGKDGPAVSDLRNRVEELAIQRDSLAALRSLTTLYSSDTSRRSSRLLDSSTKDNVYMLAAIGEMGASEGVLPPPEAQPASPIRRDILDVLRIRGKEDTVIPGLRERIEERIKSVHMDNVVSLALIAHSRTARKSLWGNSGGEIQLLEGLLAHARVTPKTPFETMLTKTANEASAILSRELADRLTLRWILSDYEVKGSRDADPVNDRVVSITAEPFVLEADYKPQPYTSDWEDMWGQVTWHSKIDSRVTSPITAFAAPGFLLNGMPQISDPSWICALDPEKRIPNWYIGCAFGSVQRTGLQDVETAGVGAYGFGMGHRIWMPVLDPNQGAVSWGPGRPAFKVRTGFKPAAECLFIAIRWKGAASQALQFPLGALEIAGIPAKENIVEMETGWTVVCVEPDTLLEIEFRISPQIQGQSTRTWNIGFNAARTIEDYFEILPIDKTNIEAFNFVDLGVALDAVSFNTPSKSRNGLLTYAAALTAMAARQDWPVDPGQDAISASAGALVHLSVLRTLSRMDLQLLPGFGDDSSQIPWRARQNLLQRALPLLCQRVMRRYEPGLVLQLALLNGPIEKTSAARRKLNDALSALAQLTVDLGNELLKSCATALNKEAPATLNDVELISTALVGANEELSALEHDLLSSRTLGCQIIHALQHPGFPLDGPQFLPMLSDPKVLQLCPVVS